MGAHRTLSARAQISQLIACSGSYLVAAAKHLARQRPGADVVLERHLTIDDRVAVAVGAAHTTPVAIGQIAYRFGRSQAQLLEVVDHDVRGLSLAQGAAITDANGPSDHRRQPPMRLFETHQLLIARSEEHTSE